MNRWIRCIGVCLLIFAFPACKNNPAEPSSPTIDPAVLAQRLLAWSTQQPCPFVIGSETENADLITNLVSDPDGILWEFKDSLFVDSVGLAFLKRKDESELKFLADAIQPGLSEQQMTRILDGAGFQLRMMRYDSLTHALNIRLLDWAWHQLPHRMLSTTSYSFVTKGPNYGGYTPVWVSHRQTQNLQFFTRNVSVSVLHTIYAGTDTSLTFQQLQTLFEPVAHLEHYDAGWLPD